MNKLIQKYSLCNVYANNTSGYTKIVPKRDICDMSTKEWCAFFDQELTILTRRDWFYYGLDNKPNYILDDIEKIWCKLNKKRLELRINDWVFLKKLLHTIDDGIAITPKAYPHLPSFLNYLYLMQKQIKTFMNNLPNHDLYQLNDLIKN